MGVAPGGGACGALEHWGYCRGERTLDTGCGGTFLNWDFGSFGNLPADFLPLILQECSRLTQGDPWISNGLRNVFRIVSFGSSFYVWSFLVLWPI